MNSPPLTSLDDALSRLPLWGAVEGRQAISRTFKFKDFSSAMAFMAKVAKTAEALDHHPEWTNVYDRIDVVLTTHDAGGVTERDVALAFAMEAAFS